MEHDHALFVWDDHEARGGWDDLVGFFALERAMEQGRAEIGDVMNGKSAHIVNLNSQRVVKRSNWQRTESFLTAVPDTWALVWEDAP